MHNWIWGSHHHVCSDDVAILVSGRRRGKGGGDGEEEGHPHGSANCWPWRREVADGVRESQWLEPPAARLPLPLLAAAPRASPMLNRLHAGPIVGSFCSAELRLVATRGA